MYTFGATLFLLTRETILGVGILRICRLSGAVLVIGSISKADYCGRGIMEPDVRRKIFITTANMNAGAPRALIPERIKTTAVLLQFPLMPRLLDTPDIDNIDCSNLDYSLSLRSSASRPLQGSMSSEGLTSPMLDFRHRRDSNDFGTSYSVAVSNLASTEKTLTGRCGSHALRYALIKTFRELFYWLEPPPRDDVPPRPAMNSPSIENSRSRRP
ncbi:hypothetical protein FRC12_016955 [Ceratobasidium sp. 428]|nr:hypothetical protein FRC12_016955 [Ceratobasidium sp. 428]